MPLARFKSPKRSQEDIQAVLDGLLAHILTIIKPVHIFLIGSYVRGTADDFSDIDLVVVVPDDVDPSSTSFAISRQRPYREYALDLIVISISEFTKMRGIGGIAFEAAHHGKLLFGEATDP